MMKYELRSNPDVHTLKEAIDAAKEYDRQLSFKQYDDEEDRLGLLALRKRTWALVRSGKKKILEQHRGVSKRMLSDVVGA
jgi:hypothetical protein